MKIPGSITFAFAPELITQKYARYLERWGGFHDTYVGLAEIYVDTYPNVYEPGELDLATVNDIWTTYAPGLGTFTGPFLPLETTTGDIFQFQFWPLSIDPGPPPNYVYAASCATALAIWQIYAIELVQQGLRFTKGHFGRPPKN